MSSRSKWVTLLSIAFACGAVTAVACGGEREPSSPAHGLETAIAPAHTSPDPPPAIPIIPDNNPGPTTDEADAAFGTTADGGADAATDAGAGAGATVPISDADRVVAGLRAKFKSCYQTGLNDDPDMQGRVVLSAKVAGDGAVETVATSGEGLSQRVVTCMADVVKRAQFSPPGGAGSTLQIPVLFKNDGARAPAPTSKPAGAPRKGEPRPLGY